MPTVTSRDGTELYVEVVGEGEPVILLAHGLTGNRNELAIFAPFMPGTKVLMDFRGHGASGRPPAGSYSFDHMAGDVDAVADEFGVSVVAGGSMGAAATLRLLEANPRRFDRLIILLPAKLEAGDETYVRLSRMADLLEEHGPERTAEIILAEEEAAGSFEQSPASKDYRRMAILAMNSDGVPNAIRGVINDVPVRDPDRIREVTAPTLIITQQGDAFHSVEVATELHELMTNSDLMILEDQHALLREIPTLIAKVNQLLSQST
jgi:pimeloyl-ACP methyl ester carboxylesterase